VIMNKKITYDKMSYVFPVLLFWFLVLFAGILLIIFLYPPLFLNGDIFYILLTALIIALFGVFIIWVLRRAAPPGR
jgi:hypothetical protein